ncbi:MAG: CRISPR-associated endonuclease Cas2 [Balneolaceae bacterium]|nr:CRISPR-associated endonuclease Cas2 [Balneolaceae bacterium]
MKHLGYGGEDMFVVVVYDVHQSRCTKVMKFLRQWLEHRQRSVFSGFLSESQVKIMQKQLLQIIDVQYDSVIVFQSNRATQITEWTTAGADRMRHTSIIGGKKKKPKRKSKSSRNKRAKMKKNRFRFSPQKKKE